MRLFRMELYKLWHKKAFVVCSVVGVLFMLFYFWAVIVGEEISTVNGKKYTGYEAVKMDRQITEGYRGALTDEKVKQIVEEYGLPSVIEYGYPKWRDANYLNGFVTEYLSDGYCRDWNNYKVPTKTYPITDADLKGLHQALDGSIPFAYMRGWKALFDMLQMGMVLASVVLIIGISVVFAQESQTKMLPLAFTTQEGKTKDVLAKIAAAFSLTIIVYSVVVLVCIALCSCIFGMGGGNSPLSLALGQGVRGDVVFKIEYMPVQSFAGIVLGLDLLAMMLLCAVTMCVSAHCKGNFGAVSMAAILWGMPLMIRIFFGGLGYFFTSCMPIFLVQTYSVYETVSWGRGVLTVSVGIFVLMICVDEGYQVYKRRW